MAGTKRGSLPTRELMAKIEANYAATADAATTTQKTVCEAIALAEELYGNEKSVSGLSKVEHGIAVSGVLVELGYDETTLAAAVLNHLEGTQLEEVEARFGRNTKDLIAGLRKLDIYTGTTARSRRRTIEAIRRASLSLIDGDVRVVMIRLAMALVTIRAAADLPDAKRRLIAQDTRDIYAPLANRLGIWQMKWELEDLSFRYLNPEKYKEIAKALVDTRDVRHRRIENAKRTLREELAKLNIEAEVTGRPKHIYSIYRKMERKGVSVKEIMDAHALRVIIAQDEPENPDLTEEERKYARYSQCYRVLGIVHSIWTALDGEFDDYIQHPKRNGYRSLHTAVLDDTANELEVQIRTRKMHEEAEQGFAAHWIYKEGSRPSGTLLSQIESLRVMLTEMTLTQTAVEQFDQFKQPETEETDSEKPKKKEYIYVFTPQGDLFDLPKGSTPIDFAYAIHTMVGHRTRGAKLVIGRDEDGKELHRMISLTYVLQSGDVVRIDTFGRKNDAFAIGRPSRNWMDSSRGYVKTSKALNRIRAWFRKHERPQNIEYGKQYVDRDLKRLKAQDDVSYEELAAHFGDPVDDFLAKVGFGDITSPRIEGAAALVLRDKKEQREREQREQGVLDSAESEETTHQSRKLRNGQDRKGLTVQGLTGMHTTIAQCCNPIPPEPIEGYVTRGKGVTIHRASCRQLLARKNSRFPEEASRVVEASWGDQANGDSKFSVSFRAKAYRTAGLLETIAKQLQGQNVNLLKTKLTPFKKDRSRVTVFLTAEVRNLDQANWVAGKLESLAAVYEVVR